MCSRGAGETWELRTPGSSLLPLSFVVWWAQSRVVVEAKDSLELMVIRSCGSRVLVLEWEKRSIR